MVVVGRGTECTRIVMSDMRGVEVLERVRGSTLQVPSSSVLVRKVLPQRQVPSPLV